MVEMFRKKKPAKGTYRFRVHFVERALPHNQWFGIVEVWNGKIWREYLQYLRDNGFKKIEKWPSSKVEGNTREEVEEKACEVMYACAWYEKTHNPVSTEDSYVYMSDCQVEATPGLITISRKPRDVGAPYYT